MMQWVRNQSDTTALIELSTPEKRKLISYLSTFVDKRLDEIEEMVGYMELLVRSVERDTHTKLLSFPGQQLADRSLSKPGSESEYSATRYSEITTEVVNTDTTVSEEDTLDIDARIAQFEVEFGMSSSEFLKKWMEHSIPETFETNYWASLLNFKLLE